jgi:phage terminase Nu1 subunit (DNA packaging protein)
LKQREIAEALKLSKGQVSKLVAQGMPLDSVDSAQAWRAAHSKEGAGHKSHSASVAASARSIGEKLRRPGGALATAPDDPAGTLARMRETEQRSYDLIDAALKKARESQRDEDYAALPGLIRSYNQAAANSLAAASAWERHCRELGEVAPIEHLENVLDMVLEPLMAQLANLPALIAPKANPAAPAVAESVIRAELESIRTQLAKALEAPIPSAPKSA